MKLNHINKIKANISIFSTKKTSNILDGTYKSVYKGKSMNFDNLRNYVIGDDVKDIDWKSSARSGELLVKQFIAEKKHNILFVIDSGLKMDADTDTHENKGEIALNVAGTLGYIAIKNGDYVGFCYPSGSNIIFKPFKDNLYNLEEYLCCYESDYKAQNNININTTLEYVYKNVRKRMIIFVITDLAGLDSIDKNILKNIGNVHDIMAININDGYLIGNDIFDIDSNRYVPSLFLNDSKLNSIEKEVRNEILSNNFNKFKNNNSHLISISSLNDTNKKIIELLEEYKHANLN